MPDLRLYASSLMETQMSTINHKQTALDAFMVKKIEIDAMLERLSALSDDHFNCAPDDVDWSHVGTLARYATMLKEITDAAFNEGEYAE